jgi:hypothetical protein
VRGLSVLLAALGIAGFAASAYAHEKIRLSQSSVTTTCMMTCNSQYANCQSGCVANGTIPTNPAVTANPVQTCISSCTNQQLQCQIVCSRTLSN